MVKVRSSLIKLLKKFAAAVSFFLTVFVVRHVYYVPVKNKVFSLSRYD